ncbi:hypothetical protein FRC12_005098 [Ceratobasidium sp. 428]|nr:hypothetical protein FRC12_005098 [Ceratobasidium sp. 428]
MARAWQSIASSPADRYDRLHTYVPDPPSTLPRPLAPTTGLNVLSNGRGFYSQHATWLPYVWATITTSPATAPFRPSTVIPQPARTPDSEPHCHSLHRLGRSRSRYGSESTL